MRSMSSDEIRQAFLDYFASKGHRIVPSSSLVPAEDPTLLFTNAGMNQFKDVFLGREKRDYTRATTAQKCVRAGGKHNDLDAVGRTARHHTFFEMLGNFSFGDYFKRDAITYAWEFVTGVMGLPKERLYTTVFRDDDEAFALWQEIAGLPPDRITRLGEKDNFWQMGDTGPCGPCTEIFIDMKPGESCGAPECGIGKCDCDRWREFWNLVFMQFDRDSSGKLTPLPKPSVDTGLGLERMATITQGVWSNYDTDLLRPLIAEVEKLSGGKYDQGEAGTPFRVIADHIRACTFLIADGVMPSNEGRGYVLRRILRRAVRFGKTIGLDRPFFHRLVPEVVRLMGRAYPDLVEKADRIARIIAADEERFHATLEQGMRRADEILAAMRKEGRTVISGAEAFLLYDTYGFPLDLAEDIALENVFTVDRQGFEAAMEEQRRRARAAREEAERTGFAALGSLVEGEAATRFVGYDRLVADARILALLGLENRVDRAKPDDDVAVLLDETPFYAESGGQVGDTGAVAGEVDGEPFSVRVEDCRKLAGRYYLHIGRVMSGTPRAGARVRALVDQERRAAIMRNHTATHLLHRALRDVVGTHAQQAGSLVAPDRLRFDFSHGAPVTDAELTRIEDEMNAAVLGNLAVGAAETSLDEARESGAMALFGEKYGERVRVVSIGGGHSRELCGGTHVRATGEIGLCKIVSESGIGSGLRRIEAVTGDGALQLLRRFGSALDEAGELLKATPEDVPRKVAELQQQLREQQRRLAELQAKVAGAAVEQLLEQAHRLDGVAVVAGQVPVGDADQLRSAADRVRDRLASGVVVLAAAIDGKASFVAMVSPDLVARGLHAGKLVKEVAAVAGGGGGGRPDMAQAGGKDASRIVAALNRAVEAVREQLAS